MRTKLRDIWAAVNDDGTGPGEGILSQIRAVNKAMAEAIGLPTDMAGFGISVLCITYEREHFEKMLPMIRAMNKPFRIYHFQFVADETEQFNG